MAEAAERDREKRVLGCACMGCKLGDAQQGVRALWRQGYDT